MGKRIAASFCTPVALIRFASATAVLYLGALILTPFPHYLPADFGRGFLRGKEDFFYSGAYFLGFYAHIASSPIALLCGTLQMSAGLRDRCPALHRRLGRVYVVLMLVLVAPGGLIMSVRSNGGWTSAVCFALIATLAWGFTFAAWRHARAGRYAEHGRWMIRSYLMICSAILLRLVYAMLHSWGVDSTAAYQWAAWLSWVPSLLTYEAIARSRTGRARLARPSSR